MTNAPEEPSKKSAGPADAIVDPLDRLRDRRRGGRLRRLWSWLVEKIDPPVILWVGLPFYAIAWLWWTQAVWFPAWLESHLFWIFAVLPSWIGIVHFLLAERRRYERGIEELQSRKGELEKELDAAKRREEAEKLRGDDDDVTLAESDIARLDLNGAEGARRPRFGYTALGAFCLAVVFAVPAQLSTKPDAGFSTAIECYGLGPRLAAGCTGNAPATAWEQPELRLVADDADKKNEDKTEETEEKAPTGVAGGVIGLVFAGYGAYIFAVRSILARINALALTGRFLVRLSLQCAATLILGFVLGYLGAVTVVASPKQSEFVYFAIGLFPAWATSLLAARAKDLFSPEETGCTKLPLCMVDGIDEDVADRLAEVNAWDIQHLATSDPVDLVLRTQYPLDRILDWIDQAILISYVRGEIEVMRELGIRGAIDLAVLSPRNIAWFEGEATRAEAAATAAPAGTTEKADLEAKAAVQKATAKERKEQAAAVMAAIKDRTKLKRPDALSQSLYEDHAVGFVWRLWQRSRAT